jgi:hypothetical protein
LDLLDSGSRLLGLSGSAVLWIVAAMLAVYAFIGCVAGWLSWEVAGQLQSRLGRSQTESLGS